MMVEHDIFGIWERLGFMVFLSIALENVQVLSSREERTFNPIKVAAALVLRTSGMSIWIPGYLHERAVCICWIG